MQWNWRIVCTATFFVFLLIIISSLYRPRHGHDLINDPDFFDYFEYMKGRNISLLRAGAPFVKKSFVGPPVHWTRVLQKMSLLNQHRTESAGRLSLLRNMFLSNRRDITQVNFEFDYTDQVPETVKPAFEFAGEVVSMFFDDFKVPVRVKVDWNLLGTGVLAEAGPVSFHRIEVPPEYQTKFPDVTDAWAPRALAKQFKPNFFDNWGHDMVVTINRGFNFYTGFDGDVPRYQFDLVSIIMHEIQHGLGFMSLLRKDFRMGTFFYDIDFFWKSKRNNYFVYDLFLHDEDGRIVDNMRGNGSSMATASGLQRTNIVWNSLSFPEDAKPKIYAPTLWEEGSSLSHIDENHYPAGSAHSLMTPRTAEQEAVHHLGDVVVTMFSDMGYKMTNCSAIQDRTKCMMKFCSWCKYRNSEEERCYSAGEKDLGLECETGFPLYSSSGMQLHPLSSSSSSFLSFWPAALIFAVGLYLSLFF